MNVTTILGFTLITGTIVLFISKLRKQRKLFKNLPQPPGHDSIFGHLKYMGELARSLPDRLHPQIYPLIMQERHKLGKAFYVDLWPVASPWLMIQDPDLADQVVIKPSLPKYDGLKDMLRPYAGVNNLVVQEGSEWKKWRTLFNPAFSAAMLREHTQDLIYECTRFCNNLTSHAQSGKTLELESAVVELTVQIIGRIILGSSFASSSDGKQYTKILRDQASWVASSSNPLTGPFKKLNPWRALKMQLNETRMNRTIKDVVQERWKLKRDEAATKTHFKSKSAIDIAFDSILESTTTLDEHYLNILVDQMKTFLFAGHDTSSGTLCYILYLLHQNPTWLQKARDEYTSVLGPPDSIPRTISSQPSILNDLPVTAAIIKETLRLFPPASSVRSGTAETRLFDAETGDVYPTQGCMVMVASFPLHRDDAYFPDPHTFRPDRWLRAQHCSTADSVPLPPSQKTHKHAWRPFEVGPRNCIGQELAVMELKLIMALVVPRFDVVPDYAEGKGVEGFKYLGAPAYPVLMGTGKPCGGMPVRVFERVVEG